MRSESDFIREVFCIHAVLNFSQELARAWSVVNQPWCNVTIQLTVCWELRCPVYMHYLFLFTDSHAYDYIYIDIYTHTLSANNLVIFLFSLFVAFWQIHSRWVNRFWCWLTMNNRLKIKLENIAHYSKISQESVWHRSHQSLPSLKDKLIDSEVRVARCEKHMHLCNFRILYCHLVMLVIYTYTLDHFTT